MKKPLSLALIFLFVILLASCDFEDTGNSKKSVTGRAGELVIVISKDAWAASPGESIRKTLGQPQVALLQEEPLFDLIDVPHNAFTNIFKTARNIVNTRINSSVEKSGVFIKDDVWAHPQATISIHAKNAAEFEKLVSENSDKIIGYFLKAEKKRLERNYKKYFDLPIYNTLSENQNLTMYAPPGYQIVLEKDDFVWIRKDTPEITMGVFVYSFKYESDSTFTPDYLVNKRNEFLKDNVPGPRDGSYMTTEMRIEPVFNILEHNNNYAAESRGLWRTEGDFMGGAYISLAELDATRQRVVVADGFVYAPSKEKRNLLRQVEAIVYSMRFNDQEKNDKLNSQAKMGN